MAPLSPPLPPLNALRAFEAAARYLNMSRAAEELFVTPAAVSHQVIALEKHLGRKLFTRLQHGLALTADGAAYLSHVTRAFDSLRAAAAVFAEDDPGFALAVPPAFSAKWLMPRLDRLQDLLSAVTIVNEGANEQHDRLPAGVDAAIRYGAGPGAGLTATRLLDEVAIPVCHPDRVGAGLRRVADLLQYELLTGRASLPGEEFPDWPGWFAWCGVEAATPPAGLVFDHHLMTVQAALEGRGVALAKRSIVMTDLIRGNLVQLVDAAYPLAFAHFLVHRPDSPRQAEIGALTRWLAGEFASTLDRIPAAVLQSPR